MLSVRYSYYIVIGKASVELSVMEKHHAEKLIITIRHGQMN